MVGAGLVRLIIGLMHRFLLKPWKRKGCIASTDPPHHLQNTKNYSIQVQLGLIICVSNFDSIGAKVDYSDELVYENVALVVTKYIKELPHSILTPTYCTDFEVAMRESPLLSPPHPPQPNDI